MRMKDLLIFFEIAENGNGLYGFTFMEFNK